MRLLIHDANVLIDLIQVDLLESTLNLPFVMETTDLVVREILFVDQREVINSMIKRGKISVVDSSSDSIKAMVALKQEVPALSMADCSVICHALTSSAIVLSGDGKLRNTAKAKLLTVYGTLWVLQALLAEGVISPLQAVDKLTLLRRINTRLPKNECERLLDEWV